MEEALVELNRKIDALAEQVAFITEETRRQQRRGEEWDELKGDLTLVGNDLFRLSVRQLEELEYHVQIEDIFHLFKRLLRNTRQLEQALDQLESLMELWQELSPMTQDMFLSFMNRLDEMERKGYFAVMQGSVKVADRVVESLKDEDFEQLGEGAAMAVSAMREEPGSTSMFGLMRQLNDPAVRRGMARMLMVLKSIGEMEDRPCDVPGEM